MKYEIPFKLTEREISAIKILIDIIAGACVEVKKMHDENTSISEILDRLEDIDMGRGICKKASKLDINENMLRYYKERQIPYSAYIAPTPSRMVTDHIDNKSGF